LDDDVHENEAFSAQLSALSKSNLRHSRESGNPVFQSASLDSRFRWNDEGLEFPGSKLNAEC